MKRSGTTFRRHFIADSVCCPSRANILTGLMPHNTAVRENDNGPNGGNQAFERFGNPGRTQPPPGSHRSSPAPRKPSP